MARDTRREERDRRRPAPEAEEEQPKRPFQLDRDYFKLARFRMDFGNRHVPSEFWKSKGGT